jgi:hypothetical protein
LAVNDIQHIESSTYLSVDIVKIFFQPCVDVASLQARRSALTSRIDSAAAPCSSFAPWAVAGHRLRSPTRRVAMARPPRWLLSAFPKPNLLLGHVLALIDALHSQAFYVGAIG